MSVTIKFFLKLEQGTQSVCFVWFPLVKGSGKGLVINQQLVQIHGISISQLCFQNLNVIGQSQAFFSVTSLQILIFHIRYTYPKQNKLIRMITSRQNIYFPSIHFKMWLANVAFLHSSTLTAEMQLWICARVDLFSRLFVLVFFYLPHPLHQ